ncbi:MAG: TldD/PmbA family protein, partial [Nitrosopumilaceae archaeon]|nr:TldD/PmbA family protein [Nitrosopumilaceae archaeon]
MHSKKIGIDECEIVTIRKNITTVRITDSEIAEIKQNFDENFGIRLIHDKKIASIQTTNEENISNVITKGVRTIKTLKPRDF